MNSVHFTTIRVTILPIITYYNFFAQTLQESTNEKFGDDENYVECLGGVLLSSAVCLPKGYRKGELPKIPVEINTAIEVNNIREIDDKQMTVSVEFHPQLVWADNRIVTNFTEEQKKSGNVLNNINLEQIWKPDLLIENLCRFKLHYVLEDMSGLAIGNGLALGLRNETVIWYEFSAKATVYCNFDFMRYPMDEQECNFTISTTYPARRTIIFKFHTSVFKFGEATQNTDHFNIILQNVIGNMENNTKFGFTIKMSRRLQPFIMECYLPCIAIVAVSHISFIIPLDSVPGRVALLVTQFLTLTNICIHQQAASPSAGQFTALGIYLLTCLFFVVGAMIEFAILLHMRRTSDQKMMYEMVSSENLFSNMNSETNISEELIKIVKPALLMDDRIKKERRIFLYNSHKIDYVALIVFGLLFSIFNGIYWLYYLLR